MNHHHVQKLQLLRATAFKGHFCNSQQQFHLEQHITELLSCWIYPQVQSELRGLNTWFREQIRTNVSRYLGKNLQYNMSPICHVWHLHTAIFFCLCWLSVKRYRKFYFQDWHQPAGFISASKANFNCCSHVLFFENYHSCHYEPNIS